MAYPEKNASYRNKPAWMDRAVAGEKRPDGGATEMEPLINEKGNPEPASEDWKHLVEPSSHHAAQDARDQAAERTRRPALTSKEAQQKMGRGMGQSLGWKRGGSVC